MITTLNTARQVYACPVCDAPKGMCCINTTTCNERLHLASANPDVLRACVDAMWNQSKEKETPRRML